ncbi:replicative DNA helicase [Nonomuraea sp. NPDC050536]|uniref:replicative DNA helicase n=1 Tax=Nonomuraea sp. NPDC050536 TaxID=3364366 RepID=UPI0037C61E16
MEEAAELLEVDDFFSVAGYVYAAAMALLGDGKPVDPAAVFGEVQTRGHLERVGGGAYLGSLIEHAAKAGSVSYHARRIAADGLRRRMNLACSTALQVTEGRAWDAETDVDLIRKLIDEAAARRVGTEPGDVSAGMMALLDDLENPPAVTPGVAPPYLDLEMLLTSFQAGQLIVVGARPSVGKSTLAVDVARTAAIRDGHRTIIFTLEMSEREVLQRMVSAEAKVNLSTIRAYKVNELELERIAKAAAHISGAPLTIDDQPGCSLERIRARLRTLSRTGPIGIVIIDYLQLITPPKVPNREQEIAAITRGLKLLAMEFKVPIMLLSQLNRGPEQRADKKPVASDLRESGATEQDADVIILLHRDDAYDPECARAGEADLIVAKNRNGPRATITVASQLHYSRLVDMAPNQPAPQGRPDLRVVN